MKKITIKNLNLVVLICLAAVNLFAQSQREIYADTDIGWMKKIEFSTPPKSITNEDRKYTAKQVGDAQNILLWMQQTFSPKGMLGDVKWYTNTPAKSEPVTSKYYSFGEAGKNARRALPHLYGAYGKFFVFLKKDASGKFVPENNDQIRWNIEANGVENISWQIEALSTPEDYYFLMPRYEIGLKGTLNKEWNQSAANFRNFTNHPNLRNYDHYYIPSGQIPNQLDFYTVIMTKSRQPLPFEHITVGEFIKRLEERLPMIYQMQINSGSKDIDLKARAEKGFQAFKNKFAARSNEKAYLPEKFQLDLFHFADSDEKSTFPWFQTANGKYENRDGFPTFFPVLKLKKGVREASITGDPQWLVIRWNAPMSKTLAGDVHYMDSILNRFNYEYVYEYFFGDKKPAPLYKPLGF